MNVVKTFLEGVLIIEPNVFVDERGYFFESYHQESFSKAGIKNAFVQDNQSLSTYGVIRGLHAQEGADAQAKLVRVLKGRVLDVAVDMRKDSPTLGKYFSIELSDENNKQLFIPKGFLHGFAVLSETAVVLYKCDAFYVKQAEIGVRFDDPDLKIDWKIPQKDMKVSSKDQQLGYFKDVINHR